MNHPNKKVDEYLARLPDWQQKVYAEARKTIHEVVPEIAEEIKFTDRPYFTFMGNVCAFLSAKDHANIFIYDPIAPDPKGLINQGHGNSTARSIQLYEGQKLDTEAFGELIKAIADNNRKGGWRKLK